MERIQAEAWHAEVGEGFVESDGLVLAQKIDTLGASQAQRLHHQRTADPLPR